MSRIARCIQVVIALAVPVALVSCGSNEGPKPQNVKKTIPVRGIVTIDGKPAARVRVEVVPKPELAGAVAVGTTIEDGSFQVTTYNANDGAPAGEYVLTFTWRDSSMGYKIGGGEKSDDLKGKYADAKKSQHPLSVPEGSDGVDAGTIDLKK